MRNPSSDRCDACHGSGFGKRPSQYQMSLGMYCPPKSACPKCHGTGRKVEADEGRRRGHDDSAGRLLVVSRN